MEPVSVSISPKVSVAVLQYLTKKGYQLLMGKDLNDFDKELSNIIEATCADFHKSYPIQDKSNKISFYTSQTLITELLKFRFTAPLDIDSVVESIKTDERIIPPTEGQIRIFFEFFDKHIQASENLKKLAIDHTYKEEIFRLSEKIEKINDALEKSFYDIKLSNELSDEWIVQLEEIKENLKSFKPITALDRLEKLEKRIDQKASGLKKTILGKLSFIKATCYTELESFAITNQSSELFIKAYKMCPEVNEYKANAAISFFYIRDFENALKLSNDILEFDPYNSAAWLIKCFNCDTNNFETFVKTNVPVFVKEKKGFVANLFSFYNATHDTSVIQFEKLGVCINEINNLPKDINFSNRSYWNIVITYYFNKYYQKFPLYNLLGILNEELKSNEILVFLNKLLLQYKKAIDGSELLEILPDISLQYYYTNLLLTGNTDNVVEMENAFRKIKNKTLIDIFQMTVGYNSLPHNAGFLNSIEIINGYGEDKHELLALTNAYSYFIVGNSEKSRKSFNKSLSFSNVLDERVTINSIEYILNTFRNSSENIKIFIDEIYTTKDFESEILKNFFIIILYSEFNIEFDLDFNASAKLEEIKETSKDTYLLLRRYIAKALLLNKRYSEAISYLKTFLNFHQYSEELKLYCQALHEGENDKGELLIILKNCRTGVKPDYTLLRFDLYLNSLQQNWKEVIEISEIGISNFPSDEVFIYSLFQGLDKELDKSGIIKYSNLLEKFDFKNEKYSIYISGVLYRAGLISSSFELLFRTALDENNKSARQAYVSSLFQYPNEYFQDLPIVETGCFVKYELNGTVDIKTITDDTSSFLNRSFLGKKTGDPFSIVTFTGKTQFGTVLRVMNKYLALFEQILLEAQNPIHGYELEIIKFEDPSDINELTRKFKEQIGVQGSMNKIHREKELNLFFQGKRTFAEITRSVFQGNMIESYFYLTGKNSKCFRAIPGCISNPKDFNTETKFVLDSTSLCLFFQLTEELSITYKNRFVISIRIKDQILKMIEEETIMPEPKMSLEITLEELRPIFFPEGYKQDRLEFLNRLIKWIEYNCEIDTVPEKLNFLLKGANDDLKFEPYIHYLMDNRLLSDRENYYLLTNDTFYYREFKGSIDKIISPEIYLYKIHSSSFLAIKKLFLKYRYVGFAMDDTLLQEETIKMLSAQKNLFSICLDNLDYNWNPNREHIREVIIYIKWLFIIGLFNDQTKEQITTTVFFSFVKGMKPEDFKQLRDEIDQQFRLLDRYKIFVEVCLLNALKNLNKYQ